MSAQGRFDSHRVYSGGTDDIKNEAMLYSYQPISDNKKAEKDDFTEIFENAVKIATADNKKATADSEKAQLSSKKSAALALDEMATKILAKLTIIRHDGCLYYYNGRCYQIIRDEEDLLELVRSEISPDAFARVSLKCFPDLYTYMRTDKSLIPDDYKEKIRKASYYISFQNGVLNLRNLKLRSHSPEYLTFYSLDACWTDRPRTRYFRRF